MASGHLPIFGSLSAALQPITSRVAKDFEKQNDSEENESWLFFIARSNLQRQIKV
jgi:hypothetical protein